MRLTIARCSGSRNSRGRGLPGCGRGVTVPTSTKPKPSRNQAGTSTWPLSIPAASPTGLGKRRPHRVCASASRARGRRAARDQPARAAPPQGTQDLLFEAARRLRRCEAALARVFEEHGFVEVIPPSIESAEVFGEGAGGGADAL